MDFSFGDIICLKGSKNIGWDYNAYPIALRLYDTLKTQFQLDKGVYSIKKIYFMVEYQNLVVNCMYNEMEFDMFISKHGNISYELFLGDTSVNDYKWKQCFTDVKSLISFYNISDKLDCNW